MEVPEASSHSFFDSDSLRQSPRAWVCRENGEYFQTNRNISLSVSVNDNLMVNQSLSEFSRATGSAGHFRCCSSLFSQLYIISLLSSWRQGLYFCFLLIPKRWMPSAWQPDWQWLLLHGNYFIVWNIFKEMTTEIKVIIDHDQYL